MQKRIGIIKEIDSLGKLSVPKDLRVLFNLENKVKLVITEEGVLLRNPKYKLVEKNNSRRIELFGSFALLSQ